MDKFTEKSLVEDYIVKKLEENGWRIVPADELEREGYAEPLLVPNFVRALEKINKKIGIGDEEITKVVNEIKLTGTGIEGAKRILNFYKFGVPVKFEIEKIVKYVQLFDYEDIKKNDFIVSRQVCYDGKERIRTDIILYVNGIPLVNIECKNPVSISESWFNAYRDIKAYEKIAPEPYKYVQIGMAAESQARYFPIVPWQDEIKTQEWRDEDKEPLDSILEMLFPSALLDIIRNFLFVRIERGESTKVIARYMQYRAANRMVDRVLKNLNGEDEKDKGLVWHWQGSGKTLTMIFAANKLYYMKDLGNPTIFFIVDRIELEDQLYKEFNFMDIVKPEIIGSIEELQEVLNYDDYRGKRGVFITLIHKFRKEELADISKELADISSRKETIMTRENIVAFVDEGHRTQYGLLRAQMKNILKNAFFFALTGTPISKKGRDTYCEFSYPPVEPYLDRYFITDSIKDGFTVKIVYQPRLEGEIHLKKDMLETFLETEFEELPEEVREPVEERIKKRMNAIKLFLENPERIKVIAEDIAKHFKENIDGRFKAMVVAGSRKACNLYKKELDKYLPDRYSEIVMTIGDKEEEYQLLAAEAREKYGDKEWDDIRKEIVESFNEEGLPKILIVTEMLLTGFDAPILQVMYLDKLLKEHRLLQAVARTNRPFKGVKEAGLIIDYVGILKEFKRAFEMYSKEDIKDALFGFDSIKEDFIALVKELCGILAHVPRNYERESLLKAIESLTSDEAKEKDFVEGYRKLRKVFELLGPDEVKLEHFEDYKWLSAIYTYYMKVVVQKDIGEDYVQKYYEKTVRFIHKTTEIEKLNRDLPAISFDGEYLQKLDKRVKDRKEKAANILFTLNRLVLVERHMNPIYESLVEKVERLLLLWKEKTRDYEAIYEEGVKTLGEIDALTQRQKSLGFSEFEYALLLTLEKELDTEDDLTKDVKGLSQGLKNYMFPGWITQMSVKKGVEREIRRFTRGLKGRFRLSLDEMNNLHEKLMESVRNYGT